MNITRNTLLLVIAGVLTGCGYNTKAVNNFNVSAVGLTKSYSELMERSTKWCYQSMLSSHLADNEYTTQKNMQNTIDATCKKFSEDVKTAEASAVVVNTYAAALSALVGISPQFLEDDAKNLKDAVLTIKNAKGEQILQGSEVDAFEKLTNLLSEMVTTKVIKEKATQLMRENSGAVNRQVGIMLAVVKKASENSSWVARVTNENLVSNLERVGNLKTKNNKLTNEQAIPYRYLAYMLAQDHPDVDAVKKALSKFEEAGASFQLANNELEDKFARLSREEQLQSIKDLVSKVKDLRESIQAMDK